MRSAYKLAWELGCKGITVYRSGSREAEVLTAGVENEESGSGGRQRRTARQSTPSSNVVSGPRLCAALPSDVRTGQGNLFVTVNFDDEGFPFEVFGTLGKAGSTDSARLEAITRLASWRSAAVSTLSR